MKDSSLCAHPNVMMHFKYLKNLKQFSARNRTELMCVFIVKFINFALIYYYITIFIMLMPITCCYRVNLRPLSIEFDVTIIDRLIHITDNFKMLWKEYVKPSDSAVSIEEDTTQENVEIYLKLNLNYFFRKYYNYVIVILFLKNIKLKLLFMESSEIRNYVI